jgi:hypothetical protein
VCPAWRAAGIEVWFDRTELVGGDAQDRKIRGQIPSCTLVLPVISAATEARREGYFRIKCKLAARRTLAMADGTPFVLRAVIDATRDAEALVPDEFRAVPWTRRPGGETPAVFCARVSKRLEAPRSAVGPFADPSSGQRKRIPQKGHRGKSSWVIPAILAVTGGIILVVWQPWKLKSSAPPTAPVGAAAERLRPSDADTVGAAAERLRPSDADTVGVQAQREWARDSKRGRVTPRSLQNAMPGY